MNYLDQICSKDNFPFHVKLEQKKCLEYLLDMTTDQSCLPYALEATRDLIGRSHEFYNRLVLSLESSIKNKNKHNKSAK